MMAAKGTGAELPKGAGKVSRHYLPGREGKPTKVVIGGNVAPKGKPSKRQGGSGSGAKQYSGPPAHLIVAELKIVFRHRYGKDELPDDDAGRDDAELLLHALAHRGVANRLGLMNAELDQWAPWLTGEDRAAMIANVMKNPLKFEADTLAHKIGNFTDAERTFLGVTTIGSVDVTAEQRKDRQKQKNAKKHAERRRQAGAVPRDEWLAANNASRTKPWLALGMSRASYYRALSKAADEAKRHYAADGPVSRISHAVVGLAMI